MSASDTEQVGVLKVPDVAPRQSQNSNPAAFSAEAGGGPVAEVRTPERFLAAGPDPVPVGKPMSPRTKRRWIVGSISVLVIAILIGGASMVRGHLASTRFGPAAAVEKYLQSVVDGKVSQALGILDVNVTSGERILLADNVYAATKNRPSSFEVTEVTLGDKDATVSASITMDARKYPVSFSLKKNGKQALIFDKWKIAAGPEQAVRLANITGSKVNGIDVGFAEVFGTEGSSELVELPVFPGTYTFSAPAGTEFVSYGNDVSLTVYPDGANTSGGESEDVVHFGKQWTEKAAADAIAQVKTRIATCMTSDRFEPTGCEESLELYDPSYPVTSIVRTWEEEPEYEFDDGDSFEEAAVVISGGDLTVTFQKRYSGDEPWSPDSRSASGVFGSWSGTRVPVSLDEAGKLVLDFEGF